jgi:hypothetical protein
MTKNSLIKLFTMVAMSLLLGVFQVSAQSTVSGAIAGTVTDPQGKVVPNAAITVTNLGTNAAVTVNTNEDGGYRVTNLAPGKYRVETTVTGFAPAKADDITVEVSVTTPVDIPLVVGTSVNEVQVSADAPVINTSDSAHSLNINQTSINELPINGRKASTFVLGTPGVVPDGGFGLYSFRGISGLLNNATVDGGDDNQAFFSEARGRTRISYSISLDAVREFSVNTSNYSAEFGRAAGGVVNTVTKSGTNDFHGSLFYYIRDNKWGARNPLTTVGVVNSSGQTVTVALKPKDRRDQFGGSVGGPIIKDRLFFFFSYDQQKRDFPGVAGTASPTFLNPITVSGLTPAQVQAGIDYIRSLTGPVVRRGDQTIFLPKIDWIINDKNTFSAVYNRMRWESPAGVQTAALVFRGTTAWGDDFVDLDSFNARLNSTFSPSIVNEARFQISRDLERQNAQPPNANEPMTANGFPPQVSIASTTGGITLGKPNFLDRAAYPDEKRIQFADSVTWTRGKHSIKFGGDVNHVKDTLDNLFQNAGAYSYSSLANFLLDFNIPSGKRYSSFAQGFGPTAFTFKTTDINFFVQDNYQVTPRIMLNLGLRYEYQKLPKPQIPNPLEPRTADFPSDTNNFGPRIGFAVDVFGDTKTSLRGGYGIYFGRIINSTISNAITNTGVAEGQRQFSLQPSAAAAPTYPNVLAAAPAVAGSAPDIVVFDPDFQAPQIHQADIILERLIGNNTIISISGLFSAGRGLPTFFDTNLPRPTGSTTYTFTGGPFGGTLTVPRYVGPRPNTAFGRITEIQSKIKSEYYAMVLQFNRRFTDGLQFQASYTLSKSRDNAQSSVTFSNPNIPLDNFNLALETGKSNFDIPHRIVASVVYAPRTLFGLWSDNKTARMILGGFSIAPIVTVSSGTPYSYGVSGNAPSATSFGILGAGGDNRLPNTIRNGLRTQHIANVDLRISRRFKITEDMNFEVLGEAFNLFNRFQVTGVNTGAYTIATSGTGCSTAAPCLNYNANFGLPNSAGNSLVRERQIQFAARFQF